MSRPKRRRLLQFSLRGIVVLTALTAVALAWVSYWQHRIRRQRVALQEVQQLQKQIVKRSGDDIYDPITVEYNQTPWWLRVGGEPTIPVTTGVNFDAYSIRSGILDADLQMLAAFPYLKEVNVQGSDVGGQGLFWARPLRRLETLNLSETMVADDDLHALGELPALRTLALNEVKLNGSGIAHLATAPKLEYLSLNKVPLQADHIDHLNRLPALRELGLESSTLSRLHLHDLKNLHRAYISLNAEQADLRFERLPKLEYLTVGIDAIALIRSVHLSDLPALTELRLGIYGEWSPHLGGAQPGELVRQISQLHSLRSLSLRDERICDLEARQLSQLPHLQTLHLGRCSITDEGLRSIAQMKSLKELWIESKYVTADGVRHLALLPNLEGLRLEFAQDDEDFGPALLALPSLRWIDLGYCWFPSLTLSGKQASADGTSLSQISLYECYCAKIHVTGLTSVEAVRLLSAHNKGLVFEDLPNLSIVGINLDKFEKLELLKLTKLPRLQHITVSGEASQIPAEAMEQLRDWESTLPNVTIFGVQSSD